MACRFRCHLGPSRHAERVKAKGDQRFRGDHSLFRRPDIWQRGE